jgi:regulatory protein
VVDDTTARQHEERAVETAKDYALGLLTTRSRTRSEIATALDRRGVEPDITAQVLARLGDVGLLDDRAVAQAYADRESARKGPRAIAEALQRKGIDPVLAREVAGGRNPDDVRAAAVALVRQKLPTLRREARPVVERRLAALLARRGYPAGMVYAVVREVLGEIEGVDPAEAQIWAESDSD